MFDTITTGQTVTIRFAGSTQGLAMRVRYDGEYDGLQHLSGLGFMADVHLTADTDADGWTLSNGRRLFSVTPV